MAWHTKIAHLRDARVDEDEEEEEEDDVEADEETPLVDDCDEMPVDMLSVGHQSVELYDFIYPQGFADRICAYAQDVPQWADHLLDVYRLEPLVKSALRSEHEKEAEVRTWTPELEELVNAMGEEVAKVNEFYKAQLAECTAVVEELSAESISSSGHDTDFYDSLRDARKEAFRIRDEYAHVWQKLSILDQFCDINHAYISQTADFFKEHSQVQLFVPSEGEASCIDFWSKVALREVQDTITQGLGHALFNDHKTVARAELEMYRKDNQNVHSPRTIQLVRVAFFWGMAVVTLIWCLWLHFVVIIRADMGAYNAECQAQYNITCANCTDAEADKKARSKLWQVYVVIYESMALMIMWALCVAFLQHIWTASGIDYRACFSLSRYASSSSNYLTLTAGLVIIWSSNYAVFLMAGSCMFGANGIPVGVVPLVMYITMIAYIIWAFYGRMGVFWITFISPFVGVSALSGYIGDVLTSLVKPINELAYGTCVFLSGEFLLPLGNQGGCRDWWFKSKRSCWPTIVILLLPNVLRILQNLRLLYDTGQQHPCLTNTCKYVLGLFVTIFGLVHEIPDLDLQGNDHLGNLFFYCYLVPFVGSTVYSFLWDVFVDWDLAVASRFCLCIPCSCWTIRSRRLLGEVWIYRLATVADFILRFFGTMTFIPNAAHILKHTATILCLDRIAPPLEILRRTLWSVFKLEVMSLSKLGERHPIPKVEDRDESLQTNSSCKRKRLGCEIAVVVILIVGFSLAITFTEFKESLPSLVSAGDK